jgi:hypothetical protein
MQRATTVKQLNHHESGQDEKAAHRMVEIGLKAKSK